MDLWADHKDNHQEDQAPLGDGLRQTVRRSRRRLSERDVLSQLRIWLLEDYAAPYCRALASTRIFRHCYWIDALDGVSRAQLTVAPVGKSAENGTSQGGTSFGSAQDTGSVQVSGSAQGTRVGARHDPYGANGRRQKKAKPQALHEYPPVLQPVLKLSQALALESRAITLYSVFLAGGSGKARRRNESRTTKGAPDDNGSGGVTPLLLPKASGILPQSWLEAAPQILSVIEQSPAIFLLNPLAPLLFSESDLIPLYRRATPSELCLFLSHRQIIAHLQAARSPSQTVASTLTTLLRTDRWKTLIPEDKDNSRTHEGQQYEQAIAGFIELLSASLKRHFAFPVQALPIPVLIGPATVENAPYTLLFATKRQDSLFCMNDAVCRYRRRLEHDSYGGVLGEEWFRTQQQSHYDQTRQQLAQRILLQGRAQRVRRWPDLRQQLLLTRFGQFLIQDYDISIQKLLLSGDVSCSWRGGQGLSLSQQASVQRVPGNEDTLTWHS
jgi:hypothetical protein